jgi:hypothetical protein
MLFATGASSALAAEWFIQGTKLATSAALASTARVTGGAGARLEIYQGGEEAIKIECVGDLLVTKGGSVVYRAENPEIISPNQMRAKAVIYEGCNVTQPAGCFLAEVNQTIKTLPIRATLAKGVVSPEDRITIMPQTKRTLANINFSPTNTCLAGTEQAPVNGSLTIRAFTGQEEKGEQTVDGLGSLENNSLEVSSDKAFFSEGTAVLRLLSGSKWSFR